ncbi:MAG TPA: hypothetical protein VGO67_07955 [Verrucomicrobiae bacterium]|jgi:hypothetical protein
MKVNAQTRMKLFVWLLVLAFAVLSACCWMISYVIMLVLADIIPNVMLPGFTELLLRHNGWILLVPLPWVVYAIVLSGSQDLSPGSVFLFSGTVVLTLAVLICLVSLACALPYASLHQHFEP